MKVCFKPKREKHFYLGHPSHRNCGMTYKYNAQLKDHYRMHENQLFKCPFCQFKGVSREKQLNVHMNTHFRIRPYKCSKCDHRFYTKDAIRKHEEAIHEREKNYKCSFCDYKANSQSNVNAHYTRIHKDNSKCKK